MAETFKVGDKVIKVTGIGRYGPVGTVVRTTDKRKDVKVRFGDGGRIEAYTQTGYLRSSDIWNIASIKHYTDAVAKEIADAKAVYACRGAMHDLIVSSKLTPDMARRILNAINQEKEGNE